MSRVFPNTPNGAFLRFHGSNNTRDLGGYHTADGKMIAPHRLIRSGELSKLNRRGERTLFKEYGVRTIVDFRTEGEILRHPLPHLTDIQVKHIPVVQNSMLGITRDEESIVSKINALVEKGVSEQEFMRMTYENIVSSEQAMRAYRRLFEILLNQKEGATLFFCSHGRDRTGIAAMLILSALDAPKETIYADYLIPAEKEQKQQRLIDVLEAIHYVDHTHADFARSFASASRERMDGAYNWIEQHYGSIDDYLCQAIGLTHRDKMQLKRLYTT